MTKFSALLNAAPDSDGLARAIASEAFDQRLALSLAPARDDARARIESDGIARLGRVVNASALEQLNSLVSEVKQRGWPPVTVALHPAPWMLLLEVARAHFGEGAQIAPRFWLTHVAAHEGARGWRPHLDATTKSDDARLTCHVALTHATPDNGCIHVVPREVAGDFPSALFNSEKLEAARVMDLLHGARALVATPGEVILWSKNIVHWGGRASADAEGPRVSITAEIASPRAKTKLGEPPLMRAVPDEAARARLVAHQILKYARYEREQERLAPFVSLAESLVSG